jgi:thiol-disulfide isomerase/thioredoxin
LPQQVNSGDLITRIAAGKGKVVVLHFWATWCPACRREIPALNELRRRYSKEELMILGVAMDEDPRSVKSYAENREIAYSLVVAKSSVGLDFRVSGVPKTLIYDRSGELTFQGVGYLPEGKLDKTVAKILAN